MEGVAEEGEAWEVGGDEGFELGGAVEVADGVLGKAAGPAADDGEDGDGCGGGRGFEGGQNAGVPPLPLRFPFGKLRVAQGPVGMTGI